MNEALSKKKVLFKNEVSTGTKTDKSSKSTTSSIPSTKCSTRRSSSSGKSHSLSKSSRSSSSSSHIRLQHKVTKTLVRNCDALIEDVLVTKPHEIDKIKSQKNVDNVTEEMYASKPQPHTLLKTAREIQRISDLDLEEAYKELDRLSVVKTVRVPKEAIISLSNIRPNAYTRNFEAPIEVLTKPHEIDETSIQKNIENAIEKIDTLLTSELQPPTNSALQTQRIYNSDLEKGCEDLDRLTFPKSVKVSKEASIALNIHPDKRVYKDLVSVDVAESQLGPRISEVRKHKTREKSDPEPCLENFCRVDSNLQDDYYPTFSTLNLPFSLVPMYNGKKVSDRVRGWKKKTEQLLTFDKPSS